MRIIVRLFFISLLSCGACIAFAHGPQIQITNDNGTIVTRRLIAEAPYSTFVTAPTSVYVMPLLPFGGMLYSRPNGAINPITMSLTYPSGPGLAYGSDLADGGPQNFAAGSVLSVALLDGLRRWNGTSFVDAGATQLKAFRGPNANIDSPAANFAVTTDAGPFDSLSLAAVAAGYGSEAAEVHSSLRFALLGDGSSPTSASRDGVYLLTMQLSSSQIGLAPSNPYYFVLHKNAAAEVGAAVQSLGIAPELVQYVPEPVSLLLAATALVVSIGAGCGRRKRSQ
jgi:hypothetical protein